MVSFTIRSSPDFLLNHSESIHHTICDIQYAGFDKQLIGWSGREIKILHMNKDPKGGSPGVKILVRFYIDPMPRSENSVIEQIIFSTAWKSRMPESYARVK